MIELAMRRKLSRIEACSETYTIALDLITG